MDECCGPTDPSRYDAVFDARFAAKRARQYRRKGLTPTERQLVEFLVSTGTGLSGRTVLEVGGGVGEVQLELLARGAARTTNLELSAAYEVEAARLIDEAGVGDRVDRLVGIDLAASPEAVERADVVVLHRVVCCYPDVRRLLGAAADRARRTIVFSYPPRTIVTRATVAIGNLMVRVSGRSYRGYVHSPQLMLDVLRSHGLEPVYRHRGPAWCLLGAVRG
ncbi:methyltransferase domain-containing protein [Agromyces humi]|uniref:methyltransferase domain-containing protein n=1 Tax=Agromyces humi TaxID=1766800 RepID=UPI001356CFBA|nr:methyltransferase domain-containing protein [Agromyces humi]